MISGSVHTNPLTAYQAPNPGINTTDPSMFAARSVRPGPTAELKQDMLRIAGGDEQRAALLEDVTKDGGQARFKQLLERLSSAAGERNIRSTSGTQYTPVYPPENLFEGISYNDLTRNNEYVRVNYSHPNHLQERETSEGETIYKFRTDVRSWGEHSVTENIELSDCFYTQDEGGDEQHLLDSVYRHNPELAKRTGAYLNECTAAGKFFYDVQFDAKITRSGDASATIFRLIPHSEGLHFIGGKNNVRTLNVERNNVEDYNQLVDRGRPFGQSGESPFTINVENYNHGHYLTIKARCDYAQFKDADNRCDIPFEGMQTPLLEATCCKEGERQLQDTKYLYVAPLTHGGWFNVKFHITMPGFEGKSDKATGDPNVNLFIDGKEVLNTNARVGNNNWKAGEDYRPRRGRNIEPSGYHVQFGIADASGEMIVKIKNPKVKSYASPRGQNDISFPEESAISYSFTSGECQSRNRYPDKLDDVLKQLVAEGKID